MPVCSFNHIAGLAVPLVQFFDCQFRFHFDSLCHPSIVHYLNGFGIILSQERHISLEGAQKSNERLCVKVVSIRSERGLTEYTPFLLSVLVKRSQTTLHTASDIKSARRVIIGAGVQRAASPLLGHPAWGAGNRGSPKNPSLNGFDMIGKQ